MTPLAPSSIGDLAAAVAASAPAPVIVAGGGSKRPHGVATPEPAHVVDTRRLTGLVAYDPAECVVTVLAGTPVASVADTLRAQGQYLPWDPPFVAAGATIGGMVSAGLSGPGRYRYGGVRDFVIGARLVDGRGRVITSGGQVVKNAAGFLTHHAIVGSAGRLGVVAEVSLKVFPRPESTCTVVARAGATADAWAAHERLRQTTLDLDALELDGAASTVLARLAGAAGALPTRAARAARALGIAADVVDGADEATLWDAQTLARWGDARALVKVPCAPSRLVALAEACGRLGYWRSSAGGAVLYLAVDGDLAPVDAALVACRAGGTVVRGAEMGRWLGVPAASVFGQRVRQALDPDQRFR